ncbi:MAG: hypothetical protein AAFN78_03045 [Pseudomonadota bacterium]
MSNDNTTAPPRDPGDAAVSAAYRSASTEEPPAELDAAVLAMAHREVNGVHVATPRPRWFVPAAVAATVVLAASLALQVTQQSAQIVSEPTYSSAPVADEAAAPRPSDPATFARPESVMDAEPPAAAVPDRAMERRSFVGLEASSEAQADAATAPPLELPVNMTAPAPSPGEGAGTPADRQALANKLGRADAAFEEEQRARQFAPLNYLGGGSVMADAAIREAVDRAREERRDPGTWLEQIEALVAAGDVKAARTEWLAFRAVYPDNPLPPDFPKIE